MSLNTGASQLSLALKALRAHWEQTRDRWRDPVSQAFEEGHWLPLEMQVRATLQEVERLAQALSKARQDCG